jgi:mRNA interferase MazF
MSSGDPLRGEVWHVNLNPTRGHEQAGIRPALVVSVDAFNKGPAGLVVVLPITSVAKGIPFHVAINPPEGGTRERSYVKCEEPRCISKERLSTRDGKVSDKTMEEVERRLIVLLDLRSA